MQRIPFNLILIPLILFCVSCQTQEKESGSIFQDYVPPNPPKNIAEAHEILLNAEEFQIGYVLGYPEGKVAFQMILNSKDRVLLFKNLTQNGTLSAQLYGISGLFLTDRIEYERLLPEYRSRDVMVNVKGGDMVWEIRFGDVVFVCPEKSAGRTQIVHPRIGQTLMEKFQEIEQSDNIGYTTDIAGGSIPFFLADADNRSIELFE